MQYGRRSYGPQKPKSLATKARYVAESIAAHQAAGRARTMADYGITAGSELYILIEQALMKQAA